MNHSPRSGLQDTLFPLSSVPSPPPSYFCLNPSLTRALTRKLPFLCVPNSTWQSSLDLTVSGSLLKHPCHVPRDSHRVDFQEYVLNGCWIHKEFSTTKVLCVFQPDIHANNIFISLYPFSFLRRWPASYP